LESRLARWSPLSGIAFVVLFVIAGVFFDAAPDPGASDGAILTYYSDDGNQLKLEVAFLLATFAGVFFIWFAATLSARLHAADAEGGWLSRIPLISGAGSSRPTSPPLPCTSSCPTRSTTTPIDSRSTPIRRGSSTTPPTRSALKRHSLSPRHSLSRRRWFPTHAANTALVRPGRLRGCGRLPPRLPRRYDWLVPALGRRGCRAADPLRARAVFDRFVKVSTSRPSQRRSLRTLRRCRG